MEKKGEPMLVMEFMDHGSLYDLLHNETMAIEGELLLPILQDIAKGVRFLHAADPQVIHGDLKAQNILVDSKFRAKVADFGLSQKKQVGATGTPYWMAPECLRGESENTSASDVYSFGIILYEVYSRKDPYVGEDYHEVIKLVIDPKVNKRPPAPENCPPQVQGLMSDCLVSIPHNRPTFEELDQRLRRMDVTTIEPGDLHLSHQSKKSSILERTDQLLFDVFPQHIAEALRDGRKVEPEHREIVTIFFSDIVSFTDISSSLSPIKVSNLLDRLYNAFDELSRKHDVFKVCVSKRCLCRPPDIFFSLYYRLITYVTIPQCKIYLLPPQVETIGDAYMAVTNLVKDQPDHAKRIAEFAIEAVEHALMTLIDVEDPSLGFVNIRVGLHSGPVVANVVGSRNPRFCLFGDTVNTASRMESNSKKNRIHCSERSAKLVKKQYPEIGVRKRGRIPIKGKGEMKTYWINEYSSGCNRRGSIVSIESDRSMMSASSSKDEGSVGNSGLAGNGKTCQEPAQDERETPLPAKLPRNGSKKLFKRASLSKRALEEHIPVLGTLAEDGDEWVEGEERTMPLKS
jgi:class 3 adenylate cyclase